MSKETGGPAFPAMHYALGEHEHGLTLRDYFAAKAMQAYLASPLCPNEFDPKYKAESSYVMADAMLEARK